MRSRSNAGGVRRCSPAAIAKYSSTAIVMALAATNAAQAQVEPPENNRQASPPDVVVVTAQFRESTVQETPLAITALNDELLESKGISNLTDAANLAPNVSLTNDVSNFGGTAAVFIRGIGQYDPYPALEPGVGIYIDDVYYGVLAGSLIDLMDTDRIEVLRGPQGTLTGKNSIGGALKLFSKEPGPTSDDYAELGYGSRNSVLARAAANFTLVEDKLFARVSGGAKYSDGYVDQLDYACATGDFSGGTSRRAIDCKIGEQGGKEAFAARLSLLWTPTDRIKNLLIADSTRDRSQNPAIKQIFQSPLWTGGTNYMTGPEEYTNYENNVAIPTGGPFAGISYPIPNKSPVDAWGVANKLTIDLSDNFNLTSITGYRSNTSTYATTIEATPLSVLDQNWRLEHEQFTQELRLNGTLGSLVDFTLGGFYYDADGVSTVRVNIAGGLVVGGGGLNIDLLTYDPVKTTSKSVYLHTVWHLLEDLNLTVAGRYTDDSKDYTFNRLAPDGTPDPLLGGTLLNATIPFRGDRFDYRLALDYQWSSDLMTYAQVSTGYKGGGINPRPYIITQALPFDPEELVSYEVGFKSRFAGDRATLNGAVFHNEYDNFQAFLTSCDSISPFPGFPCAQSTNVGDATIDGAELEFLLEPVDGLVIDASAGYLDFQYDRVVATSGITLDMTNVYTPQWTGAGGIQYTFDLKNAGTLAPRLDVSYRSRVEPDAVNNPLSSLPERTLWSAGLIWRNRDEDLEAKLSVANLTDEFYYNANFLRSGPPYFSGVGVVGEPRTVMFSIKKRFF